MNKKILLTLFLLLLIFSIFMLFDNVSAFTVEYNGNNYDFGDVPMLNNYFIAYRNNNGEESLILNTCDDDFTVKPNNYLNSFKGYKHYYWLSTRKS